eukprot:515188_1
MGGLIDTGRPNTKEEEIGLKNGTLRFPKDLTLKQLNIKPNDVIFWTSFHDEYIKKIIMDDLTKKDVNNDINIHNAENCLFDDTKYNYDNVIKLDNLRNENSDNMQQETLKTLGICLENINMAKYQLKQSYVVKDQQSLISMVNNVSKSEAA